MNIGEHELGGRRLQQVERFTTVLRFADDRQRQCTHTVVEQLAKTPPCGRLVIDDQNAQRSLTHVPPPFPQRHAAPALRAIDARRCAASRPCASLPSHLPRLPASSFDKAFEYALRSLPSSHAIRGSLPHRNAARVFRGRCRAPSCCLIDDGARSEKQDSSESHEPRLSRERG